MRLLTAKVLCACVLALQGILLHVPALAQDERRENFIILLPHLNGETELAKSVANFLRMQVSATFREGGTNTRGRMIWGETGRAGYGLYDRALGATYLQGLWEGIEAGRH